ncbi:helix-turn-helix transcriptional regulator [Kribbella sp. NPDC005582]|uniref:helix-turn-helix transcriptional regulator n=1 Tax=Kribbella sp. NPDC005582 TaxID=3156893 RepID=UPI0033BFB181
MSTLSVYGRFRQVHQEDFVLDPLGVDEATFAVYHALLSQPDSTPEEIAALVHRPVNDVHELLDKLRKLDLLVPTWANPDGEHAVHPRVGLANLAERRRTELNAELGLLREAEATAEVVAEQYNELLTARSSGDVEVIKGRANASRRIDELALKTRDSFWALIPAHLDEATRPIEGSPDQPLLERGIKMRAVYLQNMMESKAAAEYAAAIHRMGGEVRATPTLPMRLLIFDQQIAVMPMDPDNHTAGAVIHRSPAVVNVAKALFDAYWARGSELFSPDDRDNESPLTPHEAEVLRLLAGGAKDEQVARLLGISLRTARRITANLSERLDAASRFELGVAAAKRGWV